MGLGLQGVDTGDARGERGDLTVQCEVERVERDEDLRSSMNERADAVITFKIRKMVFNRSRMIFIKCQLFVLQVQGAQQRIFVLEDIDERKYWDWGCMV